MKNYVIYISTGSVTVLTPRRKVSLVVQPLKTNDLFKYTRAQIIFSFSRTARNTDVKWNNGVTDTESQLLSKEYGYGSNFGF
jgi:hypothetical protein